jgi:ribosomal protein S18 acetylase RimI-like enzyme
MTVSEYALFIERLNREYAADKVESGAWPADDALRLADESTRSLLPQGVTTPDNALRTITDEDGQPVGSLWYAVRSQGAQTEAFLYEFLVFEDFRRRGHGEAALRLYHAEAKAMGIDQVGLHVFGHNPGALALYQRVGYQITDISMRMKLDA